MDSPKVSVVILNYNTPDMTTQCLESLALIDYRRCEVIVVDNGSSDGSAAEISRWVEGRPGVREKFTLIETGRNHGYAGGCNIGMSKALESGAEYVLLLNNDTVVDPVFLTELVRVARSDPSKGMVGSKIYYYDDPRRIWSAGGRVDWWLGRTRHLNLNEIDGGQADQVREVEYATGCALLVSRELVERVGMLDDSLFLYWEEADWCMRARRQGYTVWYAPASRVWHKVSATSNRHGEISSYYFARNRFVFMKRYARSVQRLFFTPYQVIVKGAGAMVVIGLARRDFKSARAYVRGVVDGLRYRGSGPASMG